MDLGNLGGQAGKLMPLLSKIQFPIGKDALLGTLEEKNASQPILDAVAGSTKNTFGSPQEVIQEISAKV